ncbi:hypothetical protein K1719_034587 [Acacia pycnantha]|nr:hypothetical protein K1719_034587 [Acacia pycnantha]
MQNRMYGPLQLSLIDCEMHVREVQNPPLLAYESKAWIVGSCNGLVCVGINKDDIRNFLLWNPVIGGVKQIHRTKSCKLTDLDPTGFGFSAIVNDYKIVQAYGHLKIGMIEAYSLSTGLWKEVEFESLEGVKPFNPSVTANGCIFWEGLKLEEEEVEDDSYWIVSFDIAKEVFTLISEPPQLHNSSSNFTLSVHDDKLAILSHSKIGHFPKYLYSLIDLWVLEEGIGSSTERWSWTKIYTCPSTGFPLTIWRNDIVYGSFTNESGGKPVNDKEMAFQFFINVITNEGKMFAISGGRYFNVINHVDSLVPVGNIPSEEP